MGSATGPRCGARSTLYEQPSASRQRLLAVLITFVLLVALTAEIVSNVLGLGGPAAILVVLAGAALLVAALLWGDRVALHMAGARPVTRAQEARYHNLVDGLCVSAGLSKPTLHLVEDPAVNAFTVARPRRTSIVLTRGAVAQLSRIELEAVLAHELSHVRRGDAFPSTLAVIALGAPVLVVDWAARRLAASRGGAPGGPGRLGALATAPLLVLLPLVPLFGRLLRLAVGREREAMADQGGVRLTRYPPGLVSALEKIRLHGGSVGTASRATAHLWIAPALGRGGAGGWLNRVVDGHPPTESRILALKDL